MGADYFESLDEISVNIDGNVPHIGIGPNCVIRRTIVDKNVRIGRNVQLINSAGVENADCVNGSYYIRDGIIIIPKNAIVADGTVV
jgi:glucose-1-phosphate adenylyltransferase